MINTILGLIDKELEFARTVNPMMAAGILQVRDNIIKKVMTRDKQCSTHCTNCDYETEDMHYDLLVIKLCDEGGYIISDGDGGYFDQCPSCKRDSLVLISD